MRNILSLVFATTLAAPTFAAGETPAGDSKEGLGAVLANYATDISIPDTPGMSIVGLNSESVLRPTTPRKLGLALLQGRGDGGGAKQGFALDFAPMKVFVPSLTKKAYEDSPYVMRPLWNSQISMGVGKPLSDADKSTRIGLGLSSTLWRDERSDPLLDKDHGACLDAVLRKSLPETMPQPGVSAVKSPDFKPCYDRLEQATWNASALMVGVATSRISGGDPLLLPDATPRGYWVSFNYGFENSPALQKTLQLTASLRRLRDEIIVDATDKTKFVSQDSTLVGVKLYGRTALANVFVEASRKRSAIAGRPTERADLFVLGAERKIADNVWLTLAAGSKRGGTAANPAYLSTGLKFGFEDAPVIKP